MLGAQVGQLVGLQFGSYLGRQIALGACRDDREDAALRRPFVMRIPSHALPGAVDLRPWMTPIEDQGALGSCTANAIAGALEYLVRRERGVHVDLSRLFIYYNQRLWDDCVRDDLGASVADGVRVVSRVGVPRETSWPYARDLFAVQPPIEVYREAARLRAVDWWSLPVDGEALRGCLAAGFPIVFGTRVTESFVQTARDGMCGMPRGADDRRHGRHALLMVGYEDARRLFVVRNSWGDDWGDHGYVYMPYDYVLHRAWTSGCWAIRLSEGAGFDPAEHGAVDLRSLPRAPPGPEGATAIAGGVASMGASAVVGALTGSGLLAGIAGGLVQGLTPGVSRALRRDRGAFVDRDHGDRILAVLRGDGPPPSALSHLPWDDGLDEAAVVGSIGAAPRARPAAAAPLHAAGAKTPEAGDEPAIGPDRKPVGLVGIQPARPDPRFVDAMPDHVASSWRRDGGAKGPLGAPVSEPSPMQEGAWQGVVVRFEDGAMFSWDPPPGRSRARPLVLLDRDRCFARWVELGAGRGALGWPVGETESTPDGHARMLRCTRGTILDHPLHGTRPIHGAIFVHWRALGGLEGELGYPVADPVVPDAPDGAESIRFEGGVIAWSPSKGAWRAT